MPKWPMVIVALIGIATFLTARRRRASADAAADGFQETAASAKPTGAAAAAPVEVLFGKELGRSWIPIKPVLAERIAVLRTQQEKISGFVIPSILLVDSAQLAAHDYEIQLYGARHGFAHIYSDKVLAVRGTENPRKLAGIDTRDPAFGLPATWIDHSLADEARDAGYTLVDPVTVLMTHLGEVLRSEAALLLSRADVVVLLEGVRTRQPGLIEELVPAIMTVSDVQRVLQGLLSEEVSIRNVDQIAEALVDLGRSVKDHAELTEAVRQRLSHGICHRLRGNHDQLAVLSLDPKVEQQITENIRRADKQSGGFVLEPRLAEQLIRRLVPSVESMMRQSLAPVLLCNSEIRRYVKTFTRRTIPKLSVLSVSEIPHTVDLKSFAVVKLD